MTPVEDVCRAFMGLLKHQADESHITAQQAIDKLLERLARAEKPINLTEGWNVLSPHEIPVEQLSWNNGQHFSSKQTIRTKVVRVFPETIDIT
jgi:hypothetical protein